MGLTKSEPSVFFFCMVRVKPLAHPVLPVLNSSPLSTGLEADGFYPPPQTCLFFHFEEAQPPATQFAPTAFPPQRRAFSAGGWTNPP